MSNSSITSVFSSGAIPTPTGAAVCSESSHSAMLSLADGLDGNFCFVNIPRNKADISSCCKGNTEAKAQDECTQWCQTEKEGKDFDMDDFMSCARGLVEDYRMVSVWCTEEIDAAPSNASTTGRPSATQSSGGAQSSSPSDDEGAASTNSGRYSVALGALAVSVAFAFVGFL